VVSLTVKFIYECFVCGFVKLVISATAIFCIYLHLYIDDVYKKCNESASLLLKWVSQNEAVTE